MRFPDGMRDRIAVEAKANGRSMNSEIVARLEASFGSSVAQRLNWLLGEIWTAPSQEKLSPSLIAEAIGEASSSYVEKVFSGAEEPTFKLLDQIAGFLAVNPAWLKRGSGAPFPVSDEKNYEIDLVDRLLARKPEKVVFVRNDSLQGQLVIILQHGAIKFEVIRTDIHLSEEIGNAGERNAALISLACEKLWNTREAFLFGRILNNEIFVELSSGRRHAGRIIHESHNNSWVEDWWDPKMIMGDGRTVVERWPGYGKFCRRIFRYVEGDKRLSEHRGSIKS